MLAQLIFCCRSLFTNFLIFIQLTPASTDKMATSTAKPVGDNTTQPQQHELDAEKYISMKKTWHMSINQNNMKGRSCKVGTYYTSSIIRTYDRKILIFILFQSCILKSTKSSVNPHIQDIIIIVITC